MTVPGFERMGETKQGLTGCALVRRLCACSLGLVALAAAAAAVEPVPTATGAGVHAAVELRPVAGAAHTRKPKTVHHRSPKRAPQSIANSMRFSGQINQTVKIVTPNVGGQDCVHNGFGWLWSTTGVYEPNATVNNGWVLQVGYPEAFYGSFTDSYPHGSDRTEFEYADGKTQPEELYDYIWVPQPGSGKVTVSYSADGKPSDETLATRLQITIDLTLQPLPQSEFAESEGPYMNLATAPETMKGKWTCSAKAL
jgi:hypothetical protein